MKSPLSSLLILICLLFSCQETDNMEIDSKDDAMPPIASPLFKETSIAESGLDFSNIVKEDKNFNYLKYIYAYNGGGVAIGDIDGDGLEDIFLGSNQDNDRLFKNLGGLKFKDITSEAGLDKDSGWSTGLSMVDIDADGDLDLYICKSASHKNPVARRNRLYINDGQGHFTEEGMKWGLAHEGFSTQAYFFDQDNDGDLDIYLVNHLIRVSDGIEDHWSKQDVIAPLYSDRFFQNQNGKYVDITEKSGVLNQCWGLSASIGDFNGDGKLDVYVCNDFREGDLLYVNVGPGKFKEELAAHFKHTSQYSMGSDFADLDNNGLNDLMVLDMTPAQHERSKQNMAAMRSNDFWSMVSIGYNHQYMSNMLQMDQGNGQYADLAQLAGLASTDWSWSTLLADFDNDGLKDIFVTNGIKHDVNDRDYKIAIEMRFKTGQAMSFDEVMAAWPSAQVPNVAFKNQGHVQFKEQSREWGLNSPQNSNGAAYADLDQDGDLDLVVNNMDAPVSLYENTSSQAGLTLSLKGPAQNPFALGTELVLAADGQEQYVQVFPNRGFQSGSGFQAHFAWTNADAHELKIYWPDGMMSQMTLKDRLPLIKIDYSEIEKTKGSRPKPSPAPISISPFYADITLHKENPVDDYSQERLLPQKMSGLGPCIAKGDLNGDGLMDLFIGSSHGFASHTMIQDAKGNFKTNNQTIWDAELIFEDLGALFFDKDGDGDMDLLVCSGGNEVPLGSGIYAPRIYENDGKGNLSRTALLQGLEVSGMAACAGDIDGDGDLDLFIAGRQVPGKYGATPFSYLLENKGGKFTDITALQHRELRTAGMITAAEFKDMDGDGKADLILVGEWIAPTIFYNRAGKLTEKRSMEDAHGWWYSLAIADMDGDGDQDLICGNLGKNNKFHPSADHPLEMYEGDVDGNGSHEILLSKLHEGRNVPVRGKDCSSEQVPSLNQKFPTFKAFSESDLEKLYGKEALANMQHRSVTEMASCYYENTGKGAFIKHELPLQAQQGPLMSIILCDLNKDGKPDIISAGGIYDAENETARYDAGQGTVLMNQGQGKLLHAAEYGAFLPYAVKGMVMLSEEKKVLVAVENEGVGRIVTFR